jgi:hypothetical protein
MDANSACNFGKSAKVSSIIEPFASFKSRHSDLHFSRTKGIFAAAQRIASCPFECDIQGKRLARYQGEAEGEGITG